MPMYRSNGAPILSPEQVESLLVRPAIDGSVVGKIATLVTTTGPSVRFPAVAADPNAEWVAEGAEIPFSDMVMVEVVASPAKVAAISVASSELLEDSVDGSAAGILGAGLARDLSRKLDQAFFGGMASPAPAGLAQMVGATGVTAPAQWTNLDPFSIALGMVSAQTAQLSAWAMHPNDLTSLALIKTSAGSNIPIAIVDATSETGSSIFGLPVFTSAAVPEGTVWGLDRTRTMLVVRKDATIEIDGSVFFTSDRVAIRGVMRAAFAMIHPAACAKITRAD